MTRPKFCEMLAPPSDWWWFYSVQMHQQRELSVVTTDTVLTPFYIFADLAYTIRRSEYALFELLNGK